MTIARRVLIIATLAAGLEACGGGGNNQPNANTVFPVTMEVDYVRVYSGEP